MRLPTYFISHGGGPWPWLKKEMPFYDELERSLQDIPRQLPQQPKAVLVISGHWEETAFTVMTHPKPPMIYDYFGFPEHTYHIHYSAPGSPELAKRIQELFKAAGLLIDTDPERGFDHGTYSPMFPMYPAADVPIVQLSMKKGYSPDEHLLVGRILAPLRDEGVLIIGSGLSYHNLRDFGGPVAGANSKLFDDWLQHTILESKPSDRTAGIIRWEDAPAARRAHPREDHLIPLMVALGAAEKESAHMIYHESAFMGSLSVSSFRFGSI